MKPARYFGDMLRRTYEAWSAHNGERMGAALAYYALFSLAPLLLIAVDVAGSVFGDISARDAVIKQVQAYLGPQGALAVRELMAHQPAWGSGWVGVILSIAILLLGASGMVSELQSSLNEIWEADPEPKAWQAFLRHRAIALAVALGFGLLLLLQLILGAVVAGLGKYMSSRLPLPELALHALDFGISFGVLTLFFAMIYKYLPDTRIAWGDVWTGAGVTSLLLTLGNLVVGIYLGKSNLLTAFGTTGSLILLVVWMFYCAQLLYFGAEFTHVNARTHGSRAPSRL